MSSMKYIMIDGNRPVVFLNTWGHDEMALLLRAERVTGAGFVTIIKGFAHCYGKSISLNLKSEEQDSFWLNKALGLDE